MSRFIGYRTVLRAETVKALNALFPKNLEYEDFKLDKVHFDISYPINFNLYPHVEVVYEERNIKPSGIGDTGTWVTEDGADWHYQIWLSEGNIKLNIQTRNAYEIDLISDGLIVALGFDSSLQRKINENGFLNIFVDSKNITPGITSGGGMPTYDNDDIRYMQTFLIPVRMQFCTRSRTDEYSGKIVESVQLEIATENGNLDTTVLIEE